MKRTIPLLFLIIAAVTVTACGGGKTLDTANVEKDLQKIGKDATGVETAAKCPDEVSDAEKGKTYECTLTLAGNQSNKQTVQMKIGDNDESVFANEGAATDELAIRGIVAQSDEDPATVCEHLSDDVLEQFGGEEDCPNQAAENDDSEPTNIKSLDIKGDTATMVTDESTTTFERDEQGSWVATAIE